MELGYVIEDLMISVCWTESNLAGFIKTIKYIELAASNMLAITNLAICVNLALIVMVSTNRATYNRVPELRSTNFRMVQLSHCGS